MATKSELLPALTPTKQFLYAGVVSFTFLVALPDPCLVIWLHRHLGHGARSKGHRVELWIANFLIRNSQFEIFELHTLCPMHVRYFIL